MTRSHSAQQTIFSQGLKNTLSAADAQAIFANGISIGFTSYLETSPQTGGIGNQTHLRLCNAERVEEFWVFDRQLNHLLDLLNLFV